MHSRNPDVIRLANLLCRTPSAVSLKLGNFARLDPTLRARGIQGAAHGSKSDEIVWNEFYRDWEGLAFESERLLAQFHGTPIEQSVEIELPDANFEGKEREAIVRLRVNQNFFRSAVLTAYNNRCCISGIAMPDLLNASHIVPWSIDLENRVNPGNGLCLNVLLDRAFDRGLLTVTPDHIVKISQRVKEHNVDSGLNDNLICFHNQKITLPDRFVPKPEFLHYHSTVIYKG